MMPSGGYLDVAIECDWCKVVKVLPRTLPDGWMVFGGDSGRMARYCCQTCIPMVFPESLDE